MNSASNINSKLAFAAVLASVCVAACAFENVGNSSPKDAGTTHDSGTHDSGTHPTSSNDASDVPDAGQD